jgi:hypothetical protein
MNGKGKRMSIKYARFTETRSEADPKKRAEQANNATLNGLI